LFHNQQVAKIAAVENVSLMGVAPPPPPYLMQHAVQYITREALHIAITHAQATHIAVATSTINGSWLHDP